MSGSVKNTSGGGMGGILGSRVQSSKPSRTGTALVGPQTDATRALTKAFRGEGRTTRLLTGTPGGEQIARHGQTGLFNLASFQKVKGAGGEEPPGEQIVIGEDGDHDVPEPGPGQEEAPRLHTLREKLSGVLDGMVDTGPGRSGIDRERLASRLDAVDAELRALEAERPVPEGLDLQSLRNTRRDCAVAALRLSLPGLHDVPKEQLEPLAHELNRLSDKLPNGGPGLAKLASQLSHHGRIREFADNPVRRGDAVEGMGELIGTMLDLVGPGRDGVELNALMGLNAELDGVLETLRFGAIKDVLANDRARELGVEVGALPQSERDSIEKDAREILKVDRDLAKARQQLARGLQMAGVKGFSLTGLAGMRLDSVVVDALRDKLGPDARKVGLIVAALKHAEQAALDCPASRRLRKALDGELVQARAQREQLARQHGGALTAYNSTQTGIEQIHARRRAGTSLPNDRQDLTFRRADLERYQQQLQPLRDAEAHIRDIEHRIASLTPEVETIRVAIAGLNQELKALDELDQQSVGRLEEIEDREDQFPEDMDAANDPIMAELAQERDALMAGRQERADRRAELRATLATWEHRQASLSDVDLMADALTLAQQHLRTATDELDAATRDYDRLSNSADNDAEALLLLPDAGIRLEKARRELVDAERDLSTVQLGYDAIADRPDAFGRGIGGLSTEELDTLGLSGKSPRDILDQARGLTRQGLRSANQVSALCRDINIVVARLGAPLTPLSDSVQSLNDTTQARNNEVLAERFGDALVGNIVGSTDARLGSGTLDAQMHGALVGTDDAPGKLAELRQQFDGVGQIVEDEMTSSRQAYGRAEEELLELTADLQANNVRHGESVERLGAFRGRNIDTGRPTGLRLSNDLIKAVDYLNVYGSEAEIPEGDLRDDYLRCKQGLRGFNPDTHDVPLIQWGARVPSEDQIRAWGESPEVMERAEDIVFLREGEPNTHIAIQDKVAELDRIVADRAGLMGASAPVLRDTIRAAILHTMRATGTKVDSFNPSEHAEQIRATLETWGVPVDHLGPEIDHALSQSFGPDEVNLWRATTTLSPDYLEAYRQQVEQKANQAPDSGRVPDRLSRAMLDGVDNLQPGTKVRITVGDRVEFQTGQLATPVPGLTINARLMVGGMNGIEIQRTSDGYELLIRAGVEGRIGGETTYGFYRGTGPISRGVRLEGVASIETAGYRVQGAALRFPNNDTGREAMKATLQGLMSDGEVTPEHLSQVDEVMPLVEYRGQVRGKVGAQARFRGSDVGAFIPSGGVKAQIGGSLAFKSTTSKNTNISVEKTNTTTQFEASVQANLYISPGPGLQIPGPFPDGPKGEATLLGGEAQRTISTLQNIRTKQTRGADGQVMANTERTVQMTIDLAWRTRSADERLETMMQSGGPIFRAMMEGPPDPPPGRLEECKRLVGSAGPGDLVSVNFAIDERARRAANELLAEAKAIQSGRVSSLSGADAERRVKELKDQARAILDDAGNYVPSKLQLIPVRENKAAYSLNGYFIRWDRYAEDKSEWVAAEIRFDAGEGRTIRDQLEGRI